jgi:hypothetical protein
MVTNQCPLRCAHCGPQSGPREKGVLDTTKVIEMLHAGKSYGCQMVNFSGGEPFMLGRQLAEMVEAAFHLGLVTRVTTGAYWSGNREVATKRLTELRQAGLNQVFISCSDHHQQFVPLPNVVLASTIAKDLGIDVYLTVGLTKHSRSGSRALRKAFQDAGVDIPFILPSPIIPFGRASENISGDELLLRSLSEIDGPCASALEHPTVHSSGKVTPCAVVFGRDCEGLDCGNVAEAGLPAILDRMQQNKLMIWIHRLGVVALKTLVEANSDIRFDSQYVNICHLCGQILSNPAAQKVLQGLGLLEPGHSAIRTEHHS